MTWMTKNLPRGPEPQTQQDIVEQKYPYEGIRVAKLKEDKLPALKSGFDNEDQFAKFALNTLRMRRILSWQFTACDPSLASLQWQPFATQRQSQKMNLQAKAIKVAEIMFSQAGCVGVRISVDDGIEIATTPDEPDEDLTLVLQYRPQ